MMVAIFLNYIYIESYYIYDGCYIFKLYLYKKSLYCIKRLLRQKASKKKCYTRFVTYKFKNF